MSGVCALGRAKLARYVAELREPTMRERVTTGIKAGYVGSIVTPMRAVVGNASWGGLRQAALQPAEAMLDNMMSLARSVATGGKVKPHEFREIANALDTEGLRVMARGFKKGAKPLTEGWNARKGDTIRDRVASFVQEVSTRLDASDVNRTLEYDRVKYKTKLSQTLVDGIFAALEVADRSFWQLGFDSSQYMQSKLMAIREGLRGDAAKARSAYYFENPTDEMTLRATDDANYSTFKDRGLSHRMVTAAKRHTKGIADKPIDPATRGYARAKAASMKRAAQVTDVAGEVLLPFTGVPTSVARKIYEVSPAGVLSTRLFGSQAERARVLAAAGVGTIGIAIGLDLYKKGVMTGPPPTNPSERAQWDAAGIQPYSVKVGDNWVGIKALGPVAASQFAMAAALGRSLEDGDTPAEAAGHAAGAGLKFWTQQTFVQSVGNIIDAIEGGRSAVGVAISTIPVPSIVGQANRAIDPKQRDTRSPKDQLIAKLPGGTFAAPERINVLGPTPRKTAAERLSAIVSPFPITHSRDTPLLAELRRLRVSFSMPAKSVRQEGRTERLSRADYETLVKSAAPETLSELMAVFKDPEYRAASDDERRSAFESVIREIRSEAREPIKEKLFK